MAPIHNWEDIEALGGEDWLTPAERKLIAACKAGEPCELGDGKLPPEGPASPEREIRADLLRYLILGGCDGHPVRGWGVRLYGGHITGDLDLGFARARGVTGLIFCRFEKPINALQTRFEFLNLSNSVLPALNAQGAQVRGGVFLNATSATGKVSLSGVEIGGQLTCVNATFSTTDGHALNAQGARVAGDVVLSGATATGEVSLSGAEIGGQLSCTDATFSATDGFALNAQGARVTDAVFLSATTATGEVSLSGAEIGGQLDCENAKFSATDGFALNAQRLQVHAGLIWRQVKMPKGRICFVSAHVGDLVDDAANWPGGRRLDLDGFTYDRISGAATDAGARIAWLEKGCYWNGEFLPQPFTHLATTLRAMGHDGDARTVLYRREQLIRQNIRARSRVVPNGDVGVGLRSIRQDIFNIGRWVWDWVQRAVIGYGHYPFRSLVAMAVLIAIAGVFAQYAYDEGSFAPNSGPILVSPGWQGIAGSPGNPAELWSAKGAPGQDWETFQAVAWAADLVIPIVEFGQTDAWAPSTTRGWWGAQLWWARWVFTLMGWVVTALGAAALTGLIRRD